MRYIDFDGVILDTEELLFEEWRKNPNRHLLPETEKIKYIQIIDWEELLNKAPIINDSIEVLRQMDPETTAILTRIHSLENEGAAKINFLKKHGVKQTIILNPYTVSKTKLVHAEGNILVDDTLFNLDEWIKTGGLVQFFDHYGTNIDGWGKENIKGYQRVKRINAPFE